MSTNPEFLTINITTGTNQTDALRYIECEVSGAMHGKMRIETGANPLQWNTAVRMVTDSLAHWVRRASGASIDDENGGDDEQ